MFPPNVHSRTKLKLNLEYSKLLGAGRHLNLVCAFHEGLNQNSINSHHTKFRKGLKSSTRFGSEFCVWGLISVIN